VTDRIGDLVCAMIESGLMNMFKELGYAFTHRAKRGWEFSDDTLELAGEVDLYLANDEFAILVEVKTHATQRDVMDHIKRMQKYCKVFENSKDRRKAIGAIGGGIISKEVEQFALKKGMFVIRQSGDRVELLEPKGGPKVW
jgi:Holliday junction resolvase-like predicted endonuclease